MSSIDISELSIIKTVLDNPELQDVVKEELSADMFEAHANEFTTMLNNPQDPSLVGLMLNEHLISYTKEELNNQLVIILIPFYKKKLQQLNYNSDLNYREKVNLTRQLKFKLIELQSKKLIVG